MTALKSAEVDAFLARPDPKRSIVLLFGPDAGLVRERADAIVRASVDDPNDPFALVRLDGDAIASEPTRLIDEANTMPLFGGRRAILLRTGRGNFISAVETLLAAPPPDCRVVIEAGDLRRNAPLRTLCERAKSAAAIACYIDNERDLKRLIDDEMRAAKLNLAPDARAALLALIGGDRRASRNEIRKLALYAHGKNLVALDDVLAVVADASLLALDGVLDAAFAGRTGEVETQFAKAMGAGASAGTILFAALRHVMQLHKARASLDSGENADEALRSFIPPVHFTRKSTVEAALRAWTLPRLTRAMEQLADAMLTVRGFRAPVDALAEPLAHRALLSLAVNARRKD
jgi:DNA polymerase III subunit delta